ncbi:bifunctional indole-3-glycerol-phosphate synthase TrpC/phosphoribosylanthranilate isomerase TrpF [Idiomarina seosinensis]|uniref:bifunctional indole-3-glycerol-phosphate synthase TrpC/phosphoribosylanthranilate isomerase TrpF n=1 Tax=Idiomarina seosinensis TaxID=281739 RepID=UPI00384F9333
MSDNVLAKIVADKEAQNQQQSARYPLAQIKAQLQPSDRSFYDALNQPAAGFILECKKASPSKGLIRPNFNPVALARAYQPYAAAISVLTEPDYFQGRLEYISAVRASVHQPILCKDFFIDEEQVYRARYFGADAVLLMLSVLDDESYQQLARVAKQLNMDILTEVASEAEMQRAAELGADIIGINHRDLTNLEINPNRSQELAPLAPSDALLVAESGFSEHRDIRRVSPYVNGFLVGSSLSCKNDVDAACRSLIFGDNKVCGLSRPEDAIMAAAAGASYGGLIFAPRSPRQVTVKQGVEIITAAPQLRWVGVFADQPLTEVVSDALALQLFAIQLHGHEDIDYISQLRNALKQAGADKMQIWQAVRVDSANDIEHLPDAYRIDRIVLDNGKGGTGQVFDWQTLQQLSDEQRERCLLAGGISPANAPAAIAQGLSGLDSSSRLETEPGIKDGHKIQQLFTHIRRYGRNAQQQTSSKNYQEAV